MSLLGDFDVLIMVCCFTFPSNCKLISPRAARLSPRVNGEEDSF